jgi:archaellum component FlaC
VHHVYTAVDLGALRARMDELSHQLNSADARRHEVQKSLRGASGADKAGLESRLAVLDARIARLESDIDENSSQLASLDATRFSASSGPHWGPDTGNRIADNAMPLAVIFIIFVLSPIAFAISRTIWKRGSRPVALPASTDTTQRLERIEQSVEAIAIEIERVSEGQRFVTRIMTDRSQGALTPGQPAMEPVPLGADRVVEHR